MATNLIDNYMNNYQNFRTIKSQNSFGMYQTQKSKPYQVLSTTNTLERTPANGASVSRVKRNVLVGLGAVAAATIGVVAAVKLHNVNTIEKAQKTFQKIFMRDDISLKETKAMLSRYKEIEKIENKEDYVQALFAEAKKNYGLEHTNVSCKLEDLGKTTLGASNGYGDVTININAKREGMINFIHHELRHTKQNDMMLSADPVKYANGIINRKSILEIIKKSNEYKVLQDMAKQAMPNATPKQIEEVAMASFKTRNEQRLCAEAKAKGLGTKAYSDKYKDFVDKLFAAHRKYVDPTGIINSMKYYFGFLERDARFAGENMQKIITKTKLDS